MTHARSCESAPPARPNILARLTAGSLLIGAPALSPLADQADHLGEAMHYGQHVVIVMASIVLGACARDFMRARPLGRRARSGVLLVSALALAAALSPPVSEAGGGFHVTQHGLVVLAAALAGVLLRELLTARGRWGGEALLDPSTGAGSQRAREAYRAIAASWFAVAGILPLRSTSGSRSSDSRA